jgi:hypothetical protein
MARKMGDASNAATNQEATGINPQYRPGIIELVLGDLSFAGCA